MDKVRLVFTDVADGVKGFCPKCSAFALEPTEFYGAPFVKCSSCGFEAPTSIFTITHERAHGDRALPPLQRLNGTAPQAQGTAQAQRTKLLAIKPISMWLNEAKALPPITPLFDVFWLTGELAFLFGSTNVGKTIIGVQVADAISRGAKIQGFDGTQTPMRVCYFDFELSARQFLQRYLDENGNVHQFSENFLRAEIDPNTPLPKGMNFQDFILEEIERTVIECQIQAAIIDNITALLSNITETKDALELMHKLRLLKLRHSLSMLVLSHSPKRDASRPISKNDMVGSMHLLNLCDSAFAIGQSAKETDVRYLKQIKCRSAEFRFDAENVATFRIVKNGSYLCFEHVGFDDEDNLLRKESYSELMEMAIVLSQQGLTQAEIARELSVSQATVSRLLKKADAKPLTTAEPF